MGSTDVIASVKVCDGLELKSSCDMYVIVLFDWVCMQAELGRPSAMQPDKGKVAIFVDCSPTAEPTFEVVLFDSTPLWVSYYFVDNGHLQGCKCWWYSLAQVILCNSLEIQLSWMINNIGDKSYCPLVFSVTMLMCRGSFLIYNLYVDYILGTPCVYLVWHLVWCL